MMYLLSHKTSALLKIEKELFDLFPIYDRVYPGFGKTVHSEVISLWQLKNQCGVTPRFEQLTSLSADTGGSMQESYI